MFKEQDFQSASGIAIPTKETGMIQGVNVTIVTVGFSYYLGPHMEQISQALDIFTSGINAVIFDINSIECFTINVYNVLTEMYQKLGLWDHCLVVFSNAKALGSTDTEQVYQIQRKLAHPRCPASLRTLLNKVQQRYIVVESKYDMGDNYHNTKMGQILQMVKNIKQHTPGPYNHRSFQFAFSKYREAKEKDGMKEIQQLKLLEEQHKRILEEVETRFEQQHDHLILKELADKLSLQHRKLLEVKLNKQLLELKLDVERRTAEAKARLAAEATARLEARVTKAHHKRSHKFYKFF